MSSMADDIAGTLAVTIYERCATAIAVATTNCSEAGYPLTELQQIAVTSALMQAIDGVTEHLAGQLRVDALLRTNADAFTRMVFQTEEE